MFTSKNQKKFFVRLSKRPVRTQRKILKKCPNRIISDLHNLCKQICKSKKIILNKKHIKKLFKFRKFLRHLSSVKSNKASRDYLTHNISGGFLGTLLSVLISLGATIIPKLLEG